MALSPEDLDDIRKALDAQPEGYNPPPAPLEEDEKPLEPLKRVSNHSKWLEELKDRLPTNRADGKKLTPKGQLIAHLKNIVPDIKGLANKTIEELQDLIARHEGVEFGPEDELPSEKKDIPITSEGGGTPIPPQEKKEEEKIPKPNDKDVDDAAKFLATIAREGMRSLEVLTEKTSRLTHINTKGSVQIYDSSPFYQEQALKGWRSMLIENPKIIHTVCGGSAALLVAYATPISLAAGKNLQDEFINPQTQTPSPQQ